MDVSALNAPARSLRTDDQTATIRFMSQSTPQPQPDPEPPGRKLERYRTERGWTRRRAAGKVGMSNRYLGELEDGSKPLGPKQEGILLRITWHWALSTTEQRELFDAAGLDELPIRGIPVELLTNMRELDKQSSDRLQKIQDAASAIRLRRMGILRGERKQGTEVNKPDTKPADEEVEEEVGD